MIELPSYLSETKKGVLLKLHIQPKSSKTKISGQYGDRLKISIKAPPVNGKANKAVQDFLAKFFNIPKSNIELVSGFTSRKKNFLIKNLSVKEIVKHFSF